MSNAIIRAAFESALQTWAAAQSPAFQVAYENVALNPQPAATYLRAFLLPAETGADDLAGVHRRFSGVFQVSVVIPVGVGSGPAAAVAAGLDGIFSPATPLVRSGVRIFITGPVSVAPGITEPDRFVVPISVRYRADTIS